MIAAQDCEAELVVYKSEVILCSIVLYIILSHDEQVCPCDMYVKDIITQNLDHFDNDKI